jgi:ring-1,2-phenylacetyl-CoA epoxidase subunit PaaE
LGKQEALLVCYAVINPPQLLVNLPTEYSRFPMSKYFFPLAIDEIRDESPDAYSLFFQRPDDEKFAYLAGQYLTIKVNMAGESLRRAFSLSSSPLTDDRLSVTIKRVSGGRVSNFLRDTLKAGDVLEVMPPMGNFSFTPNPDRARHYVLIGAGSGITPLMSILKTVLAGEPRSRVSLWYGNRNRASIVFREELVELGKTYRERLHVHHSLTQPEDDWQGATGRLDKEQVYDLLSELLMGGELRKQYFLCGPQGLIDGAQRALDLHGVNPPDVFREYYSAPAPTEEEVEAAYTVVQPEVENQTASTYSDGEAQYELVPQEIRLELGGTVHELTVKPDQYVLDAAIEAGIDPPFACQSGICTTCRAMLVKGVVAMDETEGLSKDELEQGYILTCQCHPLEAGVELVYQ